MLQPDLQNNTTDPSHDGRGPIPGPVPLQRNSRGLRTEEITVLTVLLVVIFGIGLLAGWTFAVSGGTGTSVVQTGTNAGAISNIEAV